MEHNDKSKLPFPFNFPPEASSSFPLASVDNSVNFPFFSQFHFDSPAESGGAKPLGFFQENQVPPFLSKTYDLVDDPSLDHIISWGKRGNSFVVWDTSDFSTIVLPRNFKHANFSSFVRQLNTYGFRKIEADKWEFANEFFLQGSKHLLKNIQRRRPRQLHQISGGESSGLIEMEKSMIMQEMEELNQQNREAAAHVESMKKRLQASEQRQKQMVSFITKTVQSLPGFIPKTRKKIVKKRSQEQSDGQVEFKPQLLHYTDFPAVNVLPDAPIPVQAEPSGVLDYGDEFSTIQHGYLIDFPEELEKDKSETLGMDHSWSNVGGRHFFSSRLSGPWDWSDFQEEGTLEVEK